MNAAPATTWQRLAVLGFALFAVCACGEGPPSTTSVAHFADVTESSGLDFVHVSGAYGKKYFPEIMGGGCAFLDYDLDGDADIVFPNGRFWKAHHRRADSPRPTMALYRNDGHGRFTDVTEALGLDKSFYGLGVAAADYDGDGDPDLLLTGIGGNRLFRNDGAAFVDVTAVSGLQGHADDYNTSAGFFDADGDGDLDLFITNYVLWSKKIDDEMNYTLGVLGRIYGPPPAWEGRHCHYYRNEGEGRFKDASKAAGVEIEDEDGNPLAKGLALTFVDLEGDGDLDVYVANDTERNFLFRNRGNGTFDEIGEEAGVAFDAAGKAMGAMGLDMADLNGDGGLAIGVGNYAGEVTSLYMTRPGVTRFRDRATAHGLTSATRMLITFGWFFFDYDLDGYLDIFQANGGIEDKGHLLEPPVPFRQPSQVFRNVAVGGKRRFELLDEERAGAVAQPVVGRGAAYADIDGDGDLDVLVAQIDGPALLLRNDAARGHHWLRVRLEGEGMNREAIGAWVELHAAGGIQRRQVMPTRSYCSQVELPVTFGLGAVDRVDALRIRWPDGTQQEATIDAVDRLVVVRKTR